jgi:hypothetical protein
MREELDRAEKRERKKNIKDVAVFFNSWILHLSRPPAGSQHPLKPQALGCADAKQSCSPFSPQHGLDSGEQPPFRADLGQNSANAFSLVSFRTGSDGQFTHSDER